MIQQICNYIILTSATIAALIACYKYFIGRPFGFLNKKANELERVRIDNAIEENNIELLDTIDTLLDKKMEEYFDTFQKKIDSKLDSIQGELTQHSQKLNNLNDDNVCQFRHSILTFYNLHKDKKEITLNDWESIRKMYQRYHDDGGNSFVVDLVNEMSQWNKI